MTKKRKNTMLVGPGGILESGKPYTRDEMNKAIKKLQRRARPGHVVVSTKQTFPGPVYLERIDWFSE